jgi:hypothetical protein
MERVSSTLSSRVFERTTFSLVCRLGLLIEALEGTFFAFGTVDRWVTGLIWGWVHVPCSKILHTLDDVPRSRREGSKGPKRPDFCAFDLIHHTSPLIRRVENEKSELLSGNALGFAVWEFLDLGHGVDDAGSTLGLWHVSICFFNATLLARRLIQLPASQ